MRLKATLLELKKSQELSEALLRERDECEEEIQNHIKKNSLLKEELNELDIQYQDISAQRDNLQHQVNLYNKCHDVHDVALQHIKSLEQQLSEAHNELQLISEREEQRESATTRALYNEVMGETAIPTVDLTACDSPCTGDQNKNKCNSREPSASRGKTRPPQAGRHAGGGGGSARQSAVGPRSRGRRSRAVRRSGVSHRAPGGGGPHRSRSAPPVRRRRARSTLAPSPHPQTPRLRPVFLWARQLHGTVQEVRCEDYDPRNRIRIARTAAGWRVIPRTEIYNSIQLPPPPPRPHRERRRRRRRALTPPPAPATSWSGPDLESHIPSHTIAVPQRDSEPTPLENLLAVAELEFHQQQEYLDTPPDDMSYEQPAESALQADDFSGHTDLFETINEAHYLPALSGPHDEALLESLVEKGCEDNQILGQALDKLAHLVNGTGEYGDEEEDMLLSGAPVADIIERLEQSLESPGRNSITAAQGLLNLQHIPTLHDHAEQIPYEEHTESVLQTEIPDSELVYNDPSPEKPEDYHDKSLEDEPVIALPDQSDLELPSVLKDEVCDNISEQVLDLPTETDNQVKLNNTVKCVNAEPEVVTIDFEKLEAANSEEIGPTDLSIKHAEETTPVVVGSVGETTNTMEDSMSEKSDEQPRDLSLHRRLPTPHASPRRIDIPRAPSRESDAMQSPQPSGIPAIPSSPELFTMPQIKSKQTLFLETLLSSPSPKMYTSEVTITKQQSEPLNLGKHRKSASPTVSSCSDEIRKLTKDFGEPQEKRIRRESTEELAKISKVFNKSDDHANEKSKKSDKPHKSSDEHSPLKQIQVLKTSPDFNIPDPMLVPKNKLNDILAAPGREIPALLIERPELRLPEAFAYPAILQDPDILVISLSQLENIVENHDKLKSAEGNATKTPPSKTSEQPQKPDQTSQPKPIPSMDALAGDIDAATSAALNQMLWLPYLSQIEAAMACSQNMDFIKALNSTGYSGANYPDLTQMFSHPSRFMNPSAFPMMPSMDYDSRLQFAMWQAEAMNQASAASRSKQTNSADTQMKELSKSTDVQNPYVHSTKNHQSKSHSAARTSPIAHNYNSPCQRGSMSHNPFLQGMYQTMNPNVRPNMPLPGLQIPYFNPNMMASQRSPRTSQQKSPTSPYFQNNNYLQSVKQSEHSSHQRSNSSSSQESPRPRISVKSLQNLLDPAAAAAASGVGGSRRHSSSSASMGGLSRRREEPEVGSTTPLGETPPQMPQHPHDHHLWHPLFGNQKGYNSPWSWTTVTATGD